GGMALVANAGKYNLDISNDVLGGRQTLIASPTVSWASLNLRREFSDRVEAFTDLSFDRNKAETVGNGGFIVSSSPILPADAPTTPFTTAIKIKLPRPGFDAPVELEDKTVRAASGVVVHLQRDWNLGVDYVWSRVRTTSTLTTASVTPAANTAITNGT